MAQAPQGKPIPELTDLTRPFWTAAKNGKLMMQRCEHCGTLDFLPKPWCIECGHLDLAWVEVKPQGTVYSHSTAYTVMMNYPAWKSDLPVVMCIIELDDGPRMYGQLTGCPPEKVHIGMRVAAYFEDVGEEAGMPKFRPI
jgi:hypothetical protein